MIKVSDLSGELLKHVTAAQTLKQRGFYVFKRLKNSYCYMYHRVLNTLSLYHFCVRCSQLVPMINTMPHQEGIIMPVSGFRPEVNENCAVRVISRVVVISYRRFGTTYPSHLQESRKFDP